MNTTPATTSDTANHFIRNQLGEEGRFDSLMDRLTGTTKEQRRKLLNDKLNASMARVSKSSYTKRKFK